MLERDIMVYAHVCVSTHIVLKWYVTDWGIWTSFVLSSVLGSFITAGPQCANITVKMVTTFTQSINFVFLLSKYPGFWFGPSKHPNCVKIHQLGSCSHDERPGQNALDILQITAPWK